MKLFYLFGGMVVLIIFLLISCQHKLIYFPRKYSANYQKIFDQIMVEIHYQTAEGRQTAFYIPPKDKNNGKPDFIWFMFGGNASLALDWSFFIQDFPNNNTGFLLLDYPGYGESEGRASPDSICQSSDEAFNELSKILRIKSIISEKQVGVLGHSLGAAIAVRFAERYPVNKIILLSPFTSLKDMACEIVGKPLCFLLRHNLDNVKGISRILKRQKIPEIIIFHGKRDEVIPVKMSRELKARFPKIEYIELANGEHNKIILEARDLIYQYMIKSGTGTFGPLSGNK